MSASQIPATIDWSVKGHGDGWKSMQDALYSHAGDVFYTS